MTDQKTGSQTVQQPAGPTDPDRMRDPDYVVRGYKAALHRRNSEKNRERTRHRVVLGGQPYVAEGARAGILSQEVRDRMERHVSNPLKDKKPEKAATDGEDSSSVSKESSGVANESSGTANESSRVANESSGVPKADE